MNIKFDYTGVYTAEFQSTTGIRLCDKVNEVFPQTRGAKSFVLKVARKPSKKAGEKRVVMEYGKLYPKLTVGKENFEFTHMRAVTVLDTMGEHVQYGERGERTLYVRLANVNS